MTTSRLKIIRRTAIALAVLVASYAAAGFWLVPKLVIKGAHEYLDVRHHRHSEIGAVRFNPFTLRLDIERFAVADADGQPLVGFGRLAAQVRARSVLRGGVEFAFVTLDAPHLRLIERRNGTLNLMDLAPPNDDPDSPTPKVWIDSLSVTHGDAEFTDQNRSTPLQVSVTAFNLELDDFYTRSQANVYRLTARTLLEATFSSNGTFGLAPVVASGDLHIGNFRAQAIADAGPNLLPFDVAHGTLDVNGRYDYAPRGTGAGVALDISDLTLHDVGLRGPGETETWVEVPQIAVTQARVDFYAATASVGELAIDGARVNAWRERDGKFNLAKLYIPLPDEPADAAAEARAPATPWHVSVPKVRVTGADVTFTDRGPRHPASFHFAPLSLGLDGLEIPGSAPIQLTLDSGVNDAGHVTLSGAIHRDPLTTEIAIDAKALPLTPLQPYLDGRAAMHLRAGSASFHGTTALLEGGGVVVDGDGQVDGLRTTDDALEEDFVRFGRLQLVGLHLTTQPLGVHLREVIARAPFARVIVGSDGHTNLAAVLHADEAATDALAAKQAAPPPPPPPPLPIDIGAVRIEGGSMNFADYSVKPQFATGIHELAGSILGLSSSPEQRATLDLTGKVDRYAPARISGEVNFLAATRYANVKMSFKNLELTGLSPYSGKFAGYWINKGKMSAELDYKIEDRKLNANHHLVVDQLTLGDHVDSPDATSLPVRLGIALLKDKDGVIDLELPVTGSLDDPDFRVGKIVWKVVVNLVTKVVTSPFRLLGSLFGGGGEELQYVEFAPGDARLGEATRTHLAALVKALDARPGLSVDVPLGFAPEADTAALATRRFDADLAARAAAQLKVEGADADALARLKATPAAYRTMLEAAYAEAMGHKAAVPAPAKGTPPAAALEAANAWLEEALRARVAIGPRDLESLAQERAAAIQAALVDGTGIDPGRVFVVKAPPQAVADGQVRLQLALH
jgi:hypothetical protein